MPDLFVGWPNDRMIIRQKILDVKLFSKSSRRQEVASVEETAAYRFNTPRLRIGHAIWSPALCTLGKRSFNPTAFTKQTFILLCMKACRCVRVWKYCCNITAAPSQVCGKTEECWNFCSQTSSTESLHPHCFWVRGCSSNALFTSCCKHECNRYLQPSDMDCDNDCSTYDLWICAWSVHVFQASLWYYSAALILSENLLPKQSDKNKASVSVEWWTQLTN